MLNYAGPRVLAQQCLGTPPCLLSSSRRVLDHDSSSAFHVLAVLDISHICLTCRERRIRSGLESFTSWHFQGPPVSTNSSGTPELRVDSLLPSVLCAVEMALLQLAAQARELPLSVAAPALCHVTKSKAVAAAGAQTAGVGAVDVIAAGVGAAGVGVSIRGAEGRDAHGVARSHVRLNALLTRGEVLSASEHEPRGPCLETGAARRRAQACCGVVKVKVGGAGSAAEEAARVR